MEGDFAGDGGDGDGGDGNDGNDDGGDVDEDARGVRRAVSEVRMVMLWAAWVEHLHFRVAFFKTYSQKPQRSPQCTRKV